MGRGLTGDDEAISKADGRNRLLFRNRDYTGWWLGETLSEFGDALSAVAYPLLILAVTGSAAGAGAAGAAASVGVLVTMLFGGALSDRFSRRKILIAVPVVQAIAVSTIVVAVVTQHVNLGHIVAVGLVQGLVSGLADGAWFGALRRVVPPTQLPTAFALSQGRTMAVRLIGPAAGGFLFGVARWVPFLGDVISFMASAFGVVLIRRSLGPDLDEKEHRESIIASIGAGIRFIRGSAYLRFLTVWAALANACNGGLLLLVIVVVESRGGGPTLVGAVSSLAAIGGLAGSFLAGRIAKRIPGRALVIVASWMTAVVVTGMALASKPWIIGALLAFMMFLVAPINVVFSTYEARTIPDELVGRVTSAINFGAASIRWLGILGAGLLASAFGPTTAIIVFAGILAAIAASTHFARGLHVLNVPIDQVTAG